MLGLQVTQTGPSPQGLKQTCKHAQLHLLTPELQQYPKCCGNTEAGFTQSGEVDKLQRWLFEVFERTGKGILGSANLTGKLRACVKLPTLYLYAHPPPIILIARGPFLTTAGPVPLLLKALWTQKEAQLPLPGVTALLPFGPSAS